jgi:hypothetical protein
VSRDPSPTTIVKRLRHIAGIAVGAAIGIYLVEPRIFSSAPLISSLSDKDLADLYKQLATAGVTLMGFLITAVAILVSLDRGREIVKELKRGESFSLLVLNLLAAVLLLFVITLMSIVGAVRADAIGAADVFVGLYEWLLLWTVAEICLGGFYFCAVTYKVASHQ